MRPRPASGTPRPCATPSATLATTPLAQTNPDFRTRTRARLLSLSSSTCVCGCLCRRDIVDLAWMSIRLQKRYASKVKRLQMRLELAEFGIPEAALCDAARARQVLTNVLGNAVRFCCAAAAGLFCATLQTACRTV